MSMKNDSNNDDNNDDDNDDNNTNTARLIVLGTCIANSKSFQISLGNQH